MLEAADASQKFNCYHREAELVYREQVRQSKVSAKCSLSLGYHHKLQMHRQNSVHVGFLWDSLHSLYYIAIAELLYT